MRQAVLAIALILAAVSGASAATCTDQATSKKLAGAALKSFMTKCQKDAQTTCDASAQDKNLAGAAKTSFTKKCVTDAVGTH
jgi:uncharacterized protein YdbL (DUF1318 family)